MRVMAHVGDESTASVACAVTTTGISLLFGGRRTDGFTLSVGADGAVRSRTSNDVDPLLGAKNTPLANVAVTVCVPSPNGAACTVIDAWPADTGAVAVNPAP